jgi:hypothetical protein
MLNKIAFRRVGNFPLFMMQLQQLPTEILLQIVEKLPTKTALESRRWNKWFLEISDYITLSVPLILIFGQFKAGINSRLYKDASSIPELELKTSVNELFLTIRINPTICLLVDNILDIGMRYLKESVHIHGFLKWKLIPYHVVDTMRNESSYKIPVTNQDLDLNDLMNTISNRFFKCTVNHPHRLSVSYIPEFATEVNLTNIHTMVPIGDLTNVQKLRMSSDGRFLDREGSMRYTIFRPIQFHATLKHLILDGPWLETMVDYSRGVIESLSTIKGLETLIVDLDQELHGEKLLYQLIVGLPKLQRFGRLGRVDKKFWRQFSKHQLHNIEQIELGNIKFPSNQLLKDNPQFLRDSGNGCVWTFPNVKRIAIYVGFQGNLDADDLLNVMKRFKEGLPSVPRPALLKRIDLFQVADVDLLQPTRWNYVSQKHGGGAPLLIYVTDDYVIDGPLQKESRTFQ